MIVVQEFVDLETPSGAMRTHILRPAAEGRYPGVLFYSEIFQLTEPVKRLAAQLAGHGHVVAVPEIYHECEPAGAVLADDPAGTVLAYAQAGSDRGNALKTTKTVRAFDDDARAVLAHLAQRGDCTGRLG